MFKNKNYVIISIGGICGGIIGAIICYAYNSDNLAIYIISGVIIGALISTMYCNFSNNKGDNAKIQLRAEKLDISKEKVKTGEVNMYKKIIKQDKNIVVPTEREELVVESKNADGNEEVINIPIKEEQIEVKKHSVALEDVNVYKKQTSETKHIKEKLKKEKEKINTKGNANKKK